MSVVVVEEKKKVWECGVGEWRGSFGTTNKYSKIIEDVGNIKIFYKAINF